MSRFRHNIFILQYNLSTGPVVVVVVVVVTVVVTATAAAAELHLLLVPLLPVVVAWCSS